MLRGGCGLLRTAGPRLAWKGGTPPHVLRGSGRRGRRAPEPAAADVVPTTAKSSAPTASPTVPPRPQGLRASEAAPLPAEPGPLPEAAAEAELEQRRSFTHMLSGMVEPEGALNGGFVEHQLLRMEPASSPLARSLPPPPAARAAARAPAAAPPPPPLPPPPAPPPPGSSVRSWIDDRAERWRRYATGFFVANGLLAGLLYFQFEYGFEVTRCTGPSMLPTLAAQGDVVVVRRFSRFWRSYGLGDIVVARSMNNPSYNVIKRIVGMPGDTVIVDPREPELQLFVVPPGHVWLAGDNMANSTDSRTYGSVPINMLRGRVDYRLLPLSHARRISNGFEAPTEPVRRTRIGNRDITDDA